MAKRLRHTLGVLALLGASILLAAGLGEIGLRLLGHHGVPVHDMSDRVRPVDDPVLDYRYIPDTEFWTGDVAYRFNGAGFRDVEHPVDAGPGVERIVVVGDSVSVGYGVPFEQIFASELRRRLGTSVEVLNVAMSGLNAPQEVHLLEVEGLRYDPDLVVLNFVLNDCDFHTRYRAALAYREKKDSEIGLLGIPVPPELKRALKSSALIYFVKQRVELLVASEADVDPDYVARIWDEPANREKVRDALARLAALGRAHDLEVLVAIWPVLVDFEDYPYREIHAWVAEEARSRGLAALDLLPAFAGSGGPRGLQITPDDVFHPNARGHALAAEAFLGWYRSREIPVGDQRSTPS